MLTIKSQGHTYEIDKEKMRIRFKKGSHGNWCPWITYCNHFSIPRKFVEIELQRGVVLTFHLWQVKVSHD